MSNLKGINVAAPVVPYTTDDIFPSHLALYGQGGWRTVNNLNERAAIPYARLELGMIVCVLDSGLGIKKRYELTGLSGSLASWVPTWTEFTVAGTVGWGNIAGNILNQYDLLNYFANYQNKAIPFGVGLFNVGDYILFRTGTYEVKTSFILSAQDFTTNGSFNSFKSNEINLALVYHKRAASGTSVNKYAGNQTINLASASNYTDFDIEVSGLGTLDITLTAGEILTGGELIIFATLYAGQRILLSSGFYSAVVSADTSILVAQHFVLLFKADFAGSQYLLLNSPSNSYGTTQLKSDLQTILFGSSNTTINVIPNAIEGPSLQTALKDWNALTVYKKDSIIKFEGLLFRALLDSASNAFTTFSNAYSAGSWEYFSHADTHKTFVSLDSTTLSWDWATLPVLNLTSGITNTLDCVISIPYTALYSGVDMTVVFRRTSAQNIVFDVNGFIGVPAMPSWSGVEQVLFYNFRSLKLFPKLYYTSGTVSLSQANPVSAFHGVFDAVSRTIILPDGAKSMIFFGMDNQSFVNPENYTLDLVSIPQKLTIGPELDTLVTGDHYWGTVITAGSLLSASPVLNVVGNILTLTTGSGSTSVPIGTSKLEFNFQQGFSNSYSTTIVQSNSGLYNKLYTSNATPVIYLNGAVATLPTSFSAGDLLTITITRTDIMFGSVVTIAS